jgi:predicted site-specific integrase-resolvase
MMKILKFKKIIYSRISKKLKNNLANQHKYMKRKKKTLLSGFKCFLIKKTHFLNSLITNEHHIDKKYFKLT